MSSETIGCHFTVSLKGKEQQLRVAGDISLVTTILVVGPGYYGYGHSLKAAKANCIASGAKRTDKMLAYMGDDSIGVTGMGAVRSDKVLVCLGDI
jgi:hypothetical protein